VIRIVEDDLADLPVAAVVRAADEDLAPVGPQSAALDLRGGDRLIRALTPQAPLEIGSAVITQAGDLAAEFVLHIIVQGEARRASRDTVRKALTSAWHRAEAWQLGAVAASLGGLVLPLEESALLLVETFQDRAGDLVFPSDLYVAVGSSGERSAIEPFLGNGRR
jgi:O-acetyl-ADP-ribose deacetylase (regulator of RNase III)